MSNKQRLSGVCAALFSVLVGMAATVRGQVDVVELSVGDIRTAYQTGEYTAVDLVESFLDRINVYEDTYNAFVSLNPNAIQQAIELDAAYAANGPVGALHGVPVVLKDNINMAGLETTAGFAGFSSVAGGVGVVPTQDASVVERLTNAGAIVLGKTNMPDFAFSGTRTWSSVAGVTKNPYNLDLAPGGSSGGTATAVNASFSVLGLGTETGGSIQNPSSAQALVGVKPTHGLVPLDGVVPINADYLDVVGPIARTVEDAALALEVLVGANGDYTSGLNLDSLEGKRFGLVGRGWRRTFLPLAPETQAFYDEAVETLIAEGAEVVEDVFSSRFDRLYRRGVLPQLFGTGLNDYLEDLGEDVAFNSIAEWEELTGERLGFAPTNPREPTAASRTSYESWREDLRTLFDETLAAQNLDGLFFPQAGSPIPVAIEDGNGPNDFPELPSNIINDLGVPVVTVPFDYYQDNSPMTLAFIGNLETEADLLSFAYDFEQATLGRRAPQLVPEPSGFALVLALVSFCGCCRTRQRRPICRR